MIEGLARSLDRRLRLSKFTREVLNHVFPDHWSFMLGEIALYSFVILVITGIFLVMFFNASDEKAQYLGSYQPLHGVQVSAAYASALHISFDVPAGLLIRQMHHWAALLFVAAIVLHLARIFFTGAYRRPREMNWIIGLTLLVLAIFNGYFGYSAPGDLLSGTGLRIAYAILLSIPLIGPWLAFIFFGGRFPTDAITPRLYSLHILIVPAIIAVLIALHVAVIWRQMHTNYPGPRRTNESIVGSRLWPGYAMKSMGLFFILGGVIAALGGLVQINPIWIYGPYDPSAALPGAQPDWYLGWIEGSMRLFPGANLHIGGWLIPEVFFSAVLLPLLVFAILYLYPFFDKLFVGDFREHDVLLRPYQQPFNTAIGCAMIAFILVLFFAGSDDVIAVATNTSVVTIRQILRTLAFAAPAFTMAVVYAICFGMRRRNPASSLTG